MWCCRELLRLLGLVLVVIACYGGSVVFANHDSAAIFGSNNPFSLTSKHPELGANNYRYSGITSATVALPSNLIPISVYCGTATVSYKNSPYCLDQPTIRASLLNTYRWACTYTIYYSYASSSMISFYDIENASCPLPTPSYPYLTKKQCQKYINSTWTALGSIDACIKANGWYNSGDFPSSLSTTTETISASQVFDRGNANFSKLVTGLIQVSSLDDSSYTPQQGSMDPNNAKYYYCGGTITYNPINMTAASSNISSASPNTNNILNLTSTSCPQNNNLNFVANALYKRCSGGDNNNCLKTDSYYIQATYYNDSQCRSSYINNIANPNYHDLTYLNRYKVQVSVSNDSKCTLANSASKYYMLVEYCPKVNVKFARQVQDQPEKRTCYYTGNATNYPGNASDTIYCGGSPTYISCDPSPCPQPSSCHGKITYCGHTITVFGKTSCGTTCNAPLSGSTVYLATYKLDTRTDALNCADVYTMDSNGNLSLTLTQGQVDPNDSAYKYNGDTITEPSCVWTQVAVNDFFSSVNLSAGTGVSALTKDSSKYLSDGSTWNTMYYFPASYAYKFTYQNSYLCTVGVGFDSDYTNFTDCLKAYNNNTQTASVQLSPSDYYNASNNAYLSQSSNSLGTQPGVSFSPVYYCGWNSAFTADTCYVDGVKQSSLQPCHDAVVSYRQQYSSTPTVNSLSHTPHFTLNDYNNTYSTIMPATDPTPGYDQYKYCSTVTNTSVTPNTTTANPVSCYKNSALATMTDCTNAWKYRAFDPSSTDGNNITVDLLRQNQLTTSAI